MKSVAAFAALAVITCFGSAVAAPITPDSSNVAASPIVAAPPAKANRLDPNAVICHTDTTTGSRLDTERVCMTRAQWEENTHQDRQWLNRSASIAKGATGH